MLRQLPFIAIYILLLARMPVCAQFKNTVVLKKEKKTAVEDYFDGSFKKNMAALLALRNKKTNVVYFSGRQSSSDKNNTLNDSLEEIAVSSVNVKGEIYAVRATQENLLFQRSGDNGITWLPAEKIINPAKNALHYKIQGIHVSGLPGIAADMHSNAYKGRIYVCWSDEKYGTKDKDVFIAYSDDKGENWTEPVLISYHPNHKEQFYPKLTVDQTNGDVYIIYYDSRNYTDAGFTDVYMARSSNGGLKFDYYKLNENKLAITPVIFSKQALGLLAFNNTAQASWTSLSNRKDTMAYSVFVNDSAVTEYNKMKALQNEDLDIARTFVYSDRMNIVFTLKKNTTVTVVVTKPLEPGFEKVILKNKKFSKGDNTLIIDAKLLGLKKGNYTLFLYYDSGNKFSWITEE